MARKRDRSKTVKRGKHRPLARPTPEPPCPARFDEVVHRIEAARSRAITAVNTQPAERHATPLPKLTGEVATLAARADDHLEKIGFHP